MSLHNFFSIAATAVILAACSDLTISEQTGTAPDAAAMTADPAISLRAAQSPDNTISITLNHGEGSATAYISAIADKPLQYAQTLRLAPASEQFVADWSDSTGIDYKLLPTAFYALGSGNTLDIPAGSTRSAENLLTIYSRNLFGTVIDPGRYLLPLVATSSLYEVRDSTILVDVTIREKYVTPEGIKLYTGDDMFTIYYLNTAEFDPRLACEMVLEDIFDQNIFPERLVGLGNIIVLRSSMLSYDESTGKVGIEPSADMRYILDCRTNALAGFETTTHTVRATWHIDGYIGNFLTLGSYLNMTDYRGFALGAANRTEWRWNLTASYKFLKKRNACINLAWNDILRQNSGFSTTMSGNLWNETRETGVTSFVEVSFAYRFNTM